MKNDKVHVSRAGSVLGVYEIDKLPDMLETGRFQPTDHYFDKDKEEWVPLATLRENAAAPPSESSGTPGSSTFRPAADSAARSRGSSGSSSRSGRRSSKAQSKARKKTESALAGWIACLFALGVAAGLWAYARSINNRLVTVERELKAEQTLVRNLRTENQLLSEITPPGHIRGMITYEPTPEQVAIMSGATVGLYPRSDVEQAMAEVLGTDSAKENAGGFNQIMTALQSAFPSPLKIELTDSNGRFKFKIPEPGDYVLVASAGRAGGGGVEKYFWLIGFSADDQPSGVVLMNESNAISRGESRLKITDIRPMVTGATRQNASETADSPTGGGSH